MRVSETMKYATAVQNIDAASVRLNRANQVASTGANVTQPSDDPAAWSTMTELQSRATIMTARSTAAKASAGDLNIAESSLASASDLLVQAKGVALAMSNGTVDAGSRAAAAAQVDSIRDQLLSLANTKGASGYLFGGNQTQAPPFDSTGKFVGDDGVRSIEVSEGKTGRANTSGAKAFTALGGSDIFGDLAQLSADLKSNNVGGITTAITTMTSDNQQMINARLDAGSTAGALTSSAGMMDGVVTTLTEAASNAGSANLTTAYSELVAAQQAYQGALTVTQRLLALPSMTPP